MKSDLVVVVADGGIEQAIRGLLTRPEAIGIRQLNGVEYPKIHKLDAGIYSTGHELANAYRHTHNHALVILDAAWDRPIDDPTKIAQIIDNNLNPTWGSSGRCIVIAPELEIWVWSDSPHVAKALGWDNMAELRNWLVNQGFWTAGTPKPTDPKTAYERAIKEKKIQKSNAIFNQLAKTVSVQRCQDQAFLKLLKVLREWFPISSEIQD